MENDSERRRGNGSRIKKSKENKKKIEATSVKKLRNIARNSTPFKLSFATRMTKEPTFVNEEDLINPTP